MFKKYYLRVVNTHRDYKYEKKVERYKLETQSSSKTTVLIGYPMSILGYFAGKTVGKDMKAFFNSTDSVLEVIIRRFSGPTIFVFFFLLGAIVFLPVAILINEVVYTGAAMTVGVAPVAHANYLARCDLKTTKKLRENSEHLQPKIVETAFQSIHHHQQPIRESAFQVLQRSFNNSPGATVKQLSAEPESICKSLLNCLEYEDLPTQQRSLACLRWFSRFCGTSHTRK